MRCLHIVVVEKYYCLLDAILFFFNAFYLFQPVRRLTE